MNVLVTGGSRGIGAACVRKFTSEGHKTAFIYRADDSAAEKVAECGAIALKADISTEAERGFAEAEALLGSVDVLINCAGVAHIAQICDTDDAALRRIFDINLTAAYVLCREASKGMVRRKRGTIINVGSVWGRVGASCETAYSASKAGLRGLTMALAKELAPSGVRVNCVEPGVIDTDMNASLGEETLREICDDIPLGRLGSVEETAELIYFLASEKASYITGQAIGIDGGFGA